MVRGQFFFVSNKSVNINKMKRNSIFVLTNVGSVSYAKVLTSPQ